MALDGTVSWLRAYPTAWRPGRAPETALALDGLDLDLGFYDISSLDGRYFVAWEMLGVSVAIDDVDGRSLDRRPVRTFVLTHTSGFTAFRWTIAFDALTASEVAALHRPIWVSSPLQHWRFEYADGSVHELSGGAREAMNWVFFDLHERAMGRTPEPHALADWNATWRASFDHLRELRGRREVATAYAVTLGSHFELRGSNEALEEIVPGSGAVVGSDLPWRVMENRSAILVSEGVALDAELGVYERRYAQLMEFLTLQRGVLRSLQRETQHVITTGASVNRDSVRRWYWQLSALTDDYVLHDQSAQLIESYKHHFTSRADLRTIHTLEEQVRRNLSSFQSQFAVADVKTTVVLTALFGVVAALTLGPLARRLAIELSGSRASPSRFDDLHPVWAIGIDIILVILVALVAAAVVRRARRLSPI